MNRTPMRPKYVLPCLLKCWNSLKQFRPTARLIQAKSWQEPTGRTRLNTPPNLLKSSKRCMRTNTRPPTQAWEPEKNRKAGGRRSPAAPLLPSNLWKLKILKVRKGKLKMTDYGLKIVCFVVGIILVVAFILSIIYCPDFWQRYIMDPINW